MYQIKHFGQTVTATGSIREAVTAAGLDVGGMDPYIDGAQSNIDAKPAAGAVVTFRPRASGKA